MKEKLKSIKIGPEIHRALKIEAAKRGETVSELAAVLLWRGLSKEEK